MNKICMIGNSVHASQNIIPSMRELNINIDTIASEYKEFQNIEIRKINKQEAEDYWNKIF